MKSNCLLPLLLCAMSTSLWAQDSKQAAPPVEKDFVKPTDFTYGTWRSSIIGGGGYVQNVIPCPSNARRFYTNVDVAGLSRSDDGGKTWRMLHGNLPGITGVSSCRGVSVDPRDDNKIIIAVGDMWARRGIFVSDDAGATFKQTLEAQYYGNGPMRQAGFILARDPKNPDVVLTAAATDGVSISLDNGKKWAPSSANTQNLYPSDIRFDRTNSQRLWLCAGGLEHDKKKFSAGFFRSDDTGRTWTKLSDESPLEIVQDPVDGGTLIGIFNREILRKSTDGGATWRDFSDGLQIERLEPGKIKETVSKSGYTALGAGPDFVLTCNTRDADIYKLKSGASKWELVKRNPPEVGDWYHKGGWLFGGAASSLTVDPHDPKHWFITDYFAIYQSYDGGENWRLTVDGLETTVSHCVLQDPTDAGMAYVGLADVGCFISTDGGLRFRKSQTPDEKEFKDAISGGGNMKCMDLCPKLPNRLYGVANNSCYAAWRADQIFISIDRGQTWVRSPMQGLPTGGRQTATTIVADLNDPYTVYVTVSGQIRPGNGGVYKSTDGGARWTFMSDGLPENGYFFPYDIWAHGRQMAAGPDGTLITISKAGNLVYRFIPATQKWERCNFARTGTPWSIAADRLKAGRFFVSTRGGGLFRTDDGGSTWKKVFSRSMPYVATDSVVQGRVAGGTNDGVVLSTDGGDTWRELDKALPARVDYAIPGFSGERLLVATGGSGVFWMPISDAGLKPISARPLEMAPAPVKVALPIVTNGDFEAAGDSPPGWNSEVKNGTIQLTRDTIAVSKRRGIAPENRACLAISTVGAPATGGVYQDCGAGMWNFRLNGSIRVQGEFTRAEISIQPLGAEGQPLPAVLTFSPRVNKPNWDEFSRTVTLPIGTTKFRVSMDLDGKGQIWLDDLKTVLPSPFYPQ